MSNKVKREGKAIRIKNAKQFAALKAALEQRHGRPFGDAEALEGAVRVALHVHADDVMPYSTTALQEMMAAKTYLNTVHNVRLALENLAPGEFEINPIPDTLSLEIRRVAEGKEGSIVIHGTRAGQGVN